MPRLKHGETDANVWAEEFLRIWGDRLEKIDHDTMHTWFANAIESGRTAGQQEGRCAASSAS